MKPKIMGTMEAVVTELPSQRPVTEPGTGHLVMHLAYKAEMQYKRKENQVKLILCTSLDNVSLGESVEVEYHCGMRCYKHSKQHVTSNRDNCIGGFYFTNGTPA